MRSPLFARLLLILALLFAQLGGLTHGISHALENQSGSSGQSRNEDKSLPHDKHCDLCAAYAQIGSAMISPGIGFTGSENCESVHPGDYSSCITKPFVAFAARAPPYSA